MAAVRTAVCAAARMLAGRANVPLPPERRPTPIAEDNGLPAPASRHPEGIASSGPPTPVGSP
jgi:hypothetical protein